MGAVRALVEHGADVHTQDGDGATPLHRAAQEGQQDAARALAELGTKWNGRLPNLRNLTPETAAVLKDVCRVLRIEAEPGGQAKYRGLAEFKAC